MPHIGCPCLCSFCNQTKITGKEGAPTADEVYNTVKNSAIQGNLSPNNTELAFFGGSFTAIDKDYMLSLLKAGFKTVKEFGFKGIRVSTRPDCINDDILKTLKEFKVTAIELGAQSMCEAVLLANDRGHSAQDVIDASNLIKSHGFELGLQMMTGLYTSNDKRDIFTAKEIIKLSPDTVRIYPTIVLKGTKLDKLVKEASYKAQSLDKAVALCAKILPMFYEKNIKVIRVGLHASDILEKDYVDGPYHPAFMELCKSEINYRKILEYLIKNNIKNAKIYVNPKLISQYLGQKKSNQIKFNKLGFNIEFIQDSNVTDYLIKEQD